MAGSAETGSKAELIASRGLVGRIALAFRPYLPQVIAVGGLILVSAGLGVANPLLIQVVFDDALFRRREHPT